MTRSQETTTLDGHQEPAAAVPRRAPEAEVVDLLAAEVVDLPVAEAVVEAEAQTTTALAPTAVPSTPPPKGSPRRRRTRSTPEMLKTISLDTTAKSRGSIGGRW